MDPRTKAAEDVREIFARAPKETPPRVCPSCGAEHVTQRAFCPSCGKRYDRRFARVSDTQRWILGGLALAGVIVAASSILPGVFDAKRETDARAGARARRPRRRREEAADARAAPDARAPRRPASRRARPRAPPSSSPPAASSITALEGAILADARARVERGELDGPVKRVQLRAARSATPATSARRRTWRNRRGRYDCVAVKREVMKDGKVVGLFGHPFVGTADFKRFTYVWCKDNKVPGERGKPLAKVPIPAVCIGAEGRPRVGDGYLSSTP